MRKIFSIAFLVVVSFQVIGQKNPKRIKYKDLFPLLDAKDYDAVEEDLRLYLSVERNQDEANPNYQMGLIYQDKFLNGDIFTDTSYVFSMADSAVWHLEKAKRLMDDRELRKNDEYYQSFYRRDLRTGEFGIKLSDVKLDLEKLIESITTRVNHVEDLHLEFDTLLMVEKSMIEAYNDLISEYTDFNEFVMSADLPQISELGALTDYQFRMDQTTDQIFALVTDLKLTGSYASIDYRPVQGFSSLEPIMTPLDGSLESWDIEKWSNETKSIINGEISDIKQNLVSMDEDLARAKANILDQTNALFPLKIEDELKQKIEKYGNQNTPLKLINARIKENIFLSLSDTILNPNLNDTTLITYQLEVSDSLLSLAGEMRNITEDITADILASEKYYSNFYRNRYENVENAAAYLSELNQFAKTQQLKWDTIQSYWDFRNNWGVLESDTIPLIEVDSGRYTGDYEVWKTYPVEEYEILALGIDKEKNQGFAARFGADRKVKWELNFDSELLSKEKYTFDLDTIASGTDQIAFYWFDADSTLEKNMTVVSIDLEGELNWSTTFSAKKKPVYTTYSDAIRQHTIFLYPQEVYPLPGDELGYIVIDRNGEAK